MPKDKILSSLMGFIWVLIGFAAALSLVHKGTPDFSPKDPVDIQRAKSGLNITTAENADVVVIGTSHLFRGFNPIRFETATGLTAYNLSFNGMSAPEMAHMSTYVARLAKTKNIKHVILEGRGFALPSDANLSASRVIHASLPQDWNKYKAVSNSASDLKYWEPRLKAVSGLSRLQSYELRKRPPNYVSTIEKGEARRRALKERGQNLSGSSPLKKSVRAARKNLQILEAKGFGFQDGEIKPEARADIRRKYEEISTWNRTSKLSPAETTHYQSMIRSLKDVGVKTHIVLPPTISPEWMRTHDKFANNDLTIPTYDLRIHRYGEAFSDLRNWADHGHLNGKGADIFTALLASEFLKTIAPKPSKNPAQTFLTRSVITQPDCEGTQP